MSSAPLSYEEAAALVHSHAQTLLHKFTPPIERVDLDNAAGRVLAEPLIADRDQPPFPRATRDGFACLAQEASQHIALSIAGSSCAGDPPAGPLPPHSAWEIMTGAPVPEGATAVMMVEHVHVDSGTVRLLPPRTLKPGENIVPRGAEARSGQTLLTPGTSISAAQIALAATCGLVELQVFARPRVAILCTGDEIVPPHTTPNPGQIRNSNGPMLAALVAAAGGDPWLLPPAADNAPALEAAIAQALTANLLIVTGGVSAGKFDLVEPALQRFGAVFHFTGVRIQPGKPTVFGEINYPITSHNQNQNGTKCGCFFGLPGNPISSAATFLLFAAPIIAALAGRRDSFPRFATARLQADARHAPGLTRFLPASCNFGAGSEWPQVAPVPWHGSGDIAAFALSNCFLVLPEGQEYFTAGTEVRILLP